MSAIALLRAAVRLPTRRRRAFAAVLLAAWLPTAWAGSAPLPPLFDASDPECQALETTGQAFAQNHFSGNLPPNPNGVIQNTTCFLSYMSIAIPSTGIAILDSFISGLVNMIENDLCGLIMNWWNRTTSALLQQANFQNMGVFGPAATVSGLPPVSAQPSGAYPEPQPLPPGYAIGGGGSPGNGGGPGPSGSCQILDFPWETSPTWLKQSGVTVGTSLAWKFTVPASFPAGGYVNPGQLWVGTGATVAKWSAVVASAPCVFPPGPDAVIGGLGTITSSIDGTHFYDTVGTPAPSLAVVGALLYVLQPGQTYYLNMTPLSQVCNSSGNGCDAWVSMSLPH